MAKTSGLGGVVSVADSGGTARTISNDVTNWSLSTPRGVQDVTGVDCDSVNQTGWRRCQNARNLL